MYSFLFNQTYISVFVIALLVFLLMFLWRKLTILEGNYFLLEKRVNIIKKEDRSEQLSKNLEKSDAIMKEVFKNNIKRGNCNNNDTVCNIPKNTDEEDYIMDKCCRNCQYFMGAQNWLHMLKEAIEYPDSFRSSAKEEYKNHVFEYGKCAHELATSCDVVSCNKEYQFCSTMRLSTNWCSEEGKLFNDGDPSRQEEYKLANKPWFIRFTIGFFKYLKDITI